MKRGPVRALFSAQRAARIRTEPKKANKVSRLGGERETRAPQAVRPRSGAAYPKLSAVCPRCVKEFVNFPASGAPMQASELMKTVRPPNRCRPLPGDVRDLRSNPGACEAPGPAFAKQCRPCGRTGAPFAGERDKRRGPESSVRASCARVRLYSNPASAPELHFQTQEHERITAKRANCR